ncbi:hypothetical protein WSS_A25905 [Rhodococcus opacus M213]|uniref:Acyltransferase 3 domain-containing protein n=1 Tax=Rhodococcus opacus M213 TaxID=1129896 RepID=K8XNB4_RHOOP|nr:hypothetical protein WSS_A25905 [Rhodococcus opacus M213]
MRVPWVDVAKGASIALVTLLHSTNFMVVRGFADGRWHEVNAVLEPIRMPLFFLTAGLFATSTPALPWSTVLRRRLLPLIYLYLLWTALRFAFFTAFPATSGTAETSSPWNLLTALIVPHNGLWFLYALIVFTAITRLARRIAPPVQLLAATVLAVSASRIEILSWAWDNIVSLLMFFLLGIHLPTVIHLLAAASTAARAALAAAGFAAVYLLHQHTDLGVTPAAGLALSVVGLTAGILVCAYIQRWPILEPVRILGTRTLPVYLLHEIALGILVVGATHLGADLGDRHRLLIGPLLVTAAAIGGSLLTYRLLTRLRQGWLFRLPA